MAQSWLKRVIDHLQQQDMICRVVIADAKGSTPREAGAEMVILSDGFEGTIGGGTLEYEAIAIAQRLMVEAKSGFLRHWQSFALGPSLGQCCGGKVTILFEAFSPNILSELHKLEAQYPAAWRHDGDAVTLPVPTDAVTAPKYEASAKRLYLPEAKAKRALYLYGAGHIGRAVMAVTSALDLDRYWIDDDAARFPDDIAPDITIVPAKDMVTVARHASKGAFHLVMTYSHRLDEAIVHALLTENHFARLGLIGSATKASRFRSSLSSAGIASSALERLICPVGLPQIKGKSPPMVALSIAAQLAVWLNEDDSLPTSTG